MLKKIIIALIIIFTINLTKTNSYVKAQNVSLSISPPILEAIIKPEDKIEQTYTLKNEGPDTLVSIHIFPFNQADEFGNPLVSRSIEEYDPLLLKYWFSLKEPEITFGEKFALRQGEEKKIILVIDPEDNAENGDYYFTLIFRTELDNIFVAPETKSSLSQAEIGSNILITISKDGLIKRKAAIKEFKAPKIIDSFSNFDYQIKIANIGDAYFKPFGKVTIQSVIGKKYILNLAPQNIITASSRQIYCLEEEKLVTCRLPVKFLIGPYKATLSFEVEGEKEKYQKTINTFGVPVLPLLIFIILIILLIYRQKQKKISLDNKKNKT